MCLERYGVRMYACASTRACDVCMCVKCMRAYVCMCLRASVNVTHIFINKTKASIELHYFIGVRIVFDNINIINAIKGINGKKIRTRTKNLGQK